MEHRTILSLTALVALRLAHADDTSPTEELIAYGALSNGGLLRPAIVIDAHQCCNNRGPHS